LPFKKAAVIGSGILEILAAITLLIPATGIATAWFLVGFFILLLPININAAVKRVDYEKSNYEGGGPGIYGSGYRCSCYILHGHGFAQHINRTVNYFTWLKILSWISFTVPKGCQQPNRL